MEDSTGIDTHSGERALDLQADEAV